MHPVMFKGIRSRLGLNEGFGSKFLVGSQVRQEIPDDRQKTHRSKCCEYNNKDEENSPIPLNYKSYQSSSQRFRQIRLGDFKGILQKIQI